jgi:hypothetical protein
MQRSGGKLTGEGLAGDSMLATARSKTEIDFFSVE